MRLNRFLAAAGVGSRRGCDPLIVEGRVEVNGEICVDLSRMVDPGHDEVRLDGERIRLPRRWLYYVLHKPAGFVTTRADELGRRTVDDLIGSLRGRVVPVGRLDRASEGLLLLTNNGELTQRLLHPKYRQPRTYLVWVTPAPTSPMLEEIEHGVPLGRGERSGPAHVKVLGRRGSVARVRITLREGKNREVRRIFRHFEIKVNALRRVSYAGLELGELAPGALRPLTGREVEQLAAVTGLSL
ncbi:MAG: rRNA pseudouridine synthase [Candidatus Eisenbacteria bacterium]|uniref:Pseudouridine synthase n=1 Tax=Eiseniibacteriota bacterium TaxID=2212470 RepID=A0A956M0X2_UNCEI|nr:rRNA pseudouridine synthase [Candidatus Eisenbacteria bacterium]